MLHTGWSGICTWMRMNHEVCNVINAKYLRTKLFCFSLPATFPSVFSLSQDGDKYLKSEFSEQHAKVNNKRERRQNSKKLYWEVWE
jgi:hypothetical protein